MREIKFMAWIIEENRMTEVLDIEFKHNRIKVDHSDLDGSYSYYANLRNKKERFILLQYTGRKDKKGVEIYEGDIVKSYPDPEEELHTYLEIGFIEYSAPVFQMVGKNYYGGKWISNMVFAPLEIIGNIYQNPELLE